MAKSPKSLPPTEAEYDYVIIGGGSAGCVLAARLSEDEDVTVCLLEAGPDDKSPLIGMPLAAGQLIKGGPLNWCYRTEGQAELKNRRLFWPRGKVLGGSSAINGLIYIRGNANDYDQWRQLGLAGWGFSDVLPYFRKSERNANGASTYHGGNGFLGVSNPPGALPVFADFVKAGETMGWKRTRDFNGAQQEGVGFYQQTSWEGQRMSTARAYLKSARERKNLLVRVSCLAHHLVLEGGRARGVVYARKGGRLEQIRARREVVLCGGAVNSPQLLLLSGIGDAAYLRGFDIPVVADVPGVGQNLQDHLDVSAQVETKEAISLDARRGLLSQLAIGLRYQIFKSGLGRTNGLEAGAFAKTEPQAEVPDVQFHMIAALLREHAQVRLKENGLTLQVCQLRPESRGYIALKTTDPQEPPLIQPNYLEAKRDRIVMREGLKLARKVFQHEPLASLSKQELWPGKDVRTNAELDDFVRRTAETTYHPVGTCKMGRADDKAAVLDEHCRVRSVEALRVVDASAMPTLIGGNTNAAVIMMAEKIADHMRGMPYRAPPMP